MTRWKDSDVGKDRRQEEKGMTEDEMVGWHHRLNGHEFEQSPGVVDGQGNLAYCSPRGHQGSDTTERRNNNKRTNLQRYSTRLAQVPCLDNQTDTRPEELEKDQKIHGPHVSGTKAIHTLLPSTAAGINQPGRGKLRSQKGTTCPQSSA